MTWSRLNSARARRSGQPLTFVMIDLDHFKRYNDRRGHPAGDAVLRGAAQAWLKQLRPTDILARYRGKVVHARTARHRRQAGGTIDRPLACTSARSADLFGRHRHLGRLRNVNRDLPPSRRCVAASEEGGPQSNHDLRHGATGHITVDGGCVVIRRNRPRAAGTVANTADLQVFHPAIQARSAWLTSTDVTPVHS